MTVTRELQIFPNGDFDEDPEYWEREGVCFGCGECCRRAGELRYRIQREEGHENPNPDEILEGEEGQWEQGSPIIAEDWDGYWVWWQRMDPRPNHPDGCNQYTDEGKCELWGIEEFPELCRKWPLFPGEMDKFSECGFQFLRKEKQA